MKIVIDMPDDICNRIRHHNRCVGFLDACRDRDMFVEAIKNGIPLPKDHGRLIDVDALDKYWQKYDDAFVPDSDNYVVRVRNIDKVPTVIEASKEMEK